MNTWNIFHVWVLDDTLGLMFDGLQPIKEQHKKLQQKYSLWLLLDYLKGHLNLQNTLQRHPCLPAEIYVDSVGKSEVYIILQEKKTTN